MRKAINRRGTFAFVAATLSCGLVAANASAQTAPDTLYACYVPGSGTVYRVATPGAPADCVASSHVKFSWNATGLAGRQTVTVDLVLPILPSCPDDPNLPCAFPPPKAIIIPCPAGKVAIGGGWELPDGGNIRDNGPTADEKGWRMTFAYNRNFAPRLKAWAVCVRP